MPGTLDIIALRSLVAISECGGFHRASEELRISQSAISQHVRKLESVMGRRIVERVGRVSRFTPDGEALIAEARLILSAHDDALRRLGTGATNTPTITVGTTEHAAELLLPHISRAFEAHLPGAHVKFRLDRGVRLNEALDRSAIDVAVFIGDARTPGSEPAGELPLSWYAAPGWVASRRPEPVPVVVIDEPCTIRRKALSTLADANRAASIVCEAGYLAGVLNATRAGVGVALLANVGAPPEGLECRNEDLPEVRPEPLHIRARRGADPALARVAGAAVRAALSA